MDCSDSWNILQINATQVLYEGFTQRVELSPTKSDPLMAVGW